MKFSRPQPMPLPGAPPCDDPENPSHLPVDPDDGGMPSPVVPEKEDGDTGWQPPA